MTRTEIRTYEGDGHDLQELTNRAWRETVGGKALFPLWSQRYFQWRLLDPNGGGRDFLVAAYRGTTPIGCILGEPLDFVVGGRHVRGTLSSWLTVDPTQSPPPGIALRMLSEFRRRHRKHGMSFSMGFNDAVSRRFWETLAKRPPHDVHVLDSIKMWSRIFDADVVGAAALQDSERQVAMAARFVPGLRPRPRTPVRPFLPEDLPRCRAWLQAQAERSEVAIAWSDERLELQLGHPYARTLVLDDGARGGFINYYGIELLGAAKVNVAMIDLFAGDLGYLQQLTLLQAACLRMIDEGFHMTSMMASNAAPAWALGGAGFIPYPADVDLFWFFVDPSLKLSPTTNHHVLFG